MSVYLFVPFCVWYTSTVQHGSGSGIWKVPFYLDGYSDCRGRLHHKGSFGFVQNAEKIVQVACVFFLMENKATVYLIITDMPERTHTWSPSLFYSPYITVNFRLKYV